MNKFYALVAVLALAVNMQANAALIQQAKDSGLVAIPSDPAALEKLVTTADNPITASKIELGKKLYFDPRLSLSGILSCNTCHNLGLGGVDGIPTSIGHRWMANPHHLNAPTVYNSIFNVVQFWDGRANTLE